MPRETFTEFDTDNAFDWASISRTFIDDELSIVRTIFDDGSKETQIYTDGYVSLIRKEDGPDDTEAWTSLSTEFNAQGTVIATYTTYDDGRMREQRFDGNQLKAEFITYPDGRIESVSTIYVDGVLERKFVDFSDGTTYQEEFTDGVRDTRFTSDRPTDDAPDGAKPWSAITTRYDTATGDVTEKSTSNDDGTSKLELFEDGTRTTTTQTDNDDVKNWTSIETIFDEDGVIASRETLLDNGIVRQQLFEDGVRSETIQLDNVDGSGASAPDGGAKAWQEIYTSFDSDGVITGRETVLDDGVIKLEQFEGGIRSFKVELDNVQGFGDTAPDGGAKSWQEIYTTYDSAGAISERDTVFDNGVTKLEFFIDGVRSNTTQLDNVDGSGAPAPDGGAKSWQEIYTTFDSEGVISERETVFDNGVRKQDLFENGERTLIIEEDALDAKEWDFRFTEFDSGGNREFVGTVFDNGDQSVKLFIEGTLEAFLELDSDGLDDAGNPSWGARLTEYDGGQAETTLYADPFDLPSEYLEFLNVQLVA